MPINVVWFERLAYASLGLGLLDLALDFQNLSRLSPAINLIGTLVLTLGVIALLIWLVARRRQGWARWAFLVLYLFGLPFFFMNLMQQSLLSVPISLLQVVLQGVALFFVFTGDAKTWFAQPQSAPLLDMPMPKSIERFEQLGYVGLILAIVATLFDLIDAARAPQSSVTKAILGLLEILAIGIGWLLIWLFARRRQGWARWAFLGFVLVLLAHLVLTFGRSPIWADGLNGLQDARLARRRKPDADGRGPALVPDDLLPRCGREAQDAPARTRGPAHRRRARGGHVSQEGRRPHRRGRSPRGAAPCRRAAAVRAALVGRPGDPAAAVSGRPADDGSHRRSGRDRLAASDRAGCAPGRRPRARRMVRPDPRRRSSPPTTVARRAIWHFPFGSTICPIVPT